MAQRKTQTQPAAGAAESPRHLTLESLTIVDKQGRPRIALETTEDGDPFITLMDDNLGPNDKMGALRLSLGLSGGLPVVSLSGPDDHPRAKLTIDHLGAPRLKMMDRNGIGRLELGRYYSEDNLVPIDERGCGAFIQARDQHGEDHFMLSLDGNSIWGTAQVNGARLWEVDIDPARLSAPRERPGRS